MDSRKPRKYVKADQFSTTAPINRGSVDWTITLSTPTHEEISALIHQRPSPQLQQHTSTTPTNQTNTPIDTLRRFVRHTTDTPIYSTARLFDYRIRRLPFPIPVFVRSTLRRFDDQQTLLCYSADSCDCSMDSQRFVCSSVPRLFEGRQNTSFRSFRSFRSSVRLFRRLFDCCFDSAHRKPNQKPNHQTVAMCILP